jgi:hypothetical protein
MRITKSCVSASLIVVREGAASLSAACREGLTGEAACDERHACGGWGDVGGLSRCRSHDPEPRDHVTLRWSHQWLAICWVGFPSNDCLLNLGTHVPGDERRSRVCYRYRYERCVSTSRWVMPNNLGSLWYANAGDEAPGRIRVTDADIGNPSQTIMLPVLSLPVLSKPYYLPSGCR